MADGKVHKKQQVPQGGPLGDLWKEFMAHSMKVNPSVLRLHLTFYSKRPFHTSQLNLSLPPCRPFSPALNPPPLHGAPSKGAAISPT